MKALIKLARLCSFLVLLVTIAVGSIWYCYFRPFIIQEALKSEAASLSFTSSVLESGARPEDWETRAFLPTVSIHDLAESLNGLEFVASQGKRDEAGRYDGAFIISLKRLSIETGGSQLQPRLSVTASYVPDRIDHWWSRARVALTLDAQFMPAVQTDPATGKTNVKLLVIPTSIRPSLSWNPIEIVSAGKVVSEIVAAGILLRYGEELAIAVPAMASPLRLEAKVDSKSHSDFDKGGGYDLAAKLEGPIFERFLVADIPLVTSQGIWMLGQAGRPLPKLATLPSVPSELQRTVDQLRLAVAERLKPFDRTDGLAEVHISNRQMLEMANEIKRPWKEGENKLIISSANANGIIASAFLLKDNFLGDIGLTVTPRVQDFLRGEVSFQPPQLAWVPGTGLSSTVAAKVHVTASGHTHLTTGAVGGGIGKDIDLIGEANIALPVLLKVEKRVTASGTALVIQPQLSCVRIEIDVNPATREDVIKEAWIALKPFGVRVKRNIGGGQQTPSVLLDNLPSTYVFGEQADDGKPTKASYFRYKEFQVGWAIDDVEVQSDGLSMRARVTVQRTSVDVNEISKRRGALKEDLLNSAPNIPCKPDDSYALLLLDNQVELGSNNEIVVFIKRIFKEGGHVAEETKKEIEKLAKTPFQSIADAPDNIIREGGKGLENVAKGIEGAGTALGNAGQAVGDTAKGAVCGKKCAFGKCVRVC